MSDPSSSLSRPGALVLSLDFELLWGVRDHCPAGAPYRANLAGARQAIPALLELFDEFSVAATWATVGFLFAESREELRAFAPAERPAYRRASLDPYPEPLGESEADDPLHFAPSLIEQIRQCPRQEIGCHTFSHFYCQEPGAGSQAFRADLESAVRLAARRGIELRSLVFPRNQASPAALALLPALGFTSYRGGETGWMHRTDPAVRGQWHRRIGRLADQQCAPASRLVDWAELEGETGSGLSNVRGSVFLRPCSTAQGWWDGFRTGALVRLVRRAAATGKIVHLWWHPHNFGRDTELNLGALRQLLVAFAECREQFGFASLSMAGAAAAAARRSPVAIPALLAGAGK